VYLSYSGFKYLRDCPLRYLLAYILKPKLAKEENAVNTLYGSVVGSLFEDFYEKELWRSRDPKPRKLVMDLVDKTVQRVIDEESGKDGRYIEFGVEGSNYESREALEADVRDAVGRGLDSIRHHRLVGPQARAEIKLDSTIDGHKLGGRVDFLIRRTRPHQDKIILDGKGSKKHTLAYLDWDQLKWYAMLHRERFGKLPDKVGYLLWRFQPTDSILWLEFDDTTIDEFKAMVVSMVAKTAQLIEQVEGQPAEEAAKIFKRKPSQQNCRFCTFATTDLCPRGEAIVEKLNARKARGVKGNDRDG
jgi:hypothetical protein